jgi:hypothetical protein
MMIYTDRKAIVADVNKLITMGKETNEGVVYGLKNRLKTPLATILMKIRLEGMAVELQFLFYEDGKYLPVEGSKEQFLEKVDHSAYELRRSNNVPMQDPVSRMIPPIQDFCDEFKTIADHLRYRLGF